MMRVLFFLGGVACLVAVIGMSYRHWQRLLADRARGEFVIQRLRFLLADTPRDSAVATDTTRIRRNEWREVSRRDC